MRSSKSRSRNKNRNRPSGGNIINRVFDSSGPEGKVRGTPQQIIEKYNQLARDAQLSGDRVAVENFQQHAEHYTRLLAQAQKEIEAKRESQNQQNQQHNQNNQQSNNQGGQGGQQNHQQNGGGQVAENAQQDGARGDGQQGERGGNRRGRNRGGDQQPQDNGSTIIDSDGDSGLVETPEAKADTQPVPTEDDKPRRRTRRKAPKTEDDAPTQSAAE